MRNITLFLMLLIGITTNAQKCKYQRNEVDKFTNKTILETKEDYFYMNGMGMGFVPAYSLYKSNEDRFIKLKLTSGGKLFAISQGEGIMLKLDNGDVVTLNFLESQIAESSYNSGLKSSFHKLTTLVPLSEDNISRLSQSKITDIRIYTTDGYIDNEVKPKRAGNFQTLLKCIE